MTLRWPNGKSFAFSIFDDTDLAVPGNFERVYETLGAAGFRTTKSVWPVTNEGQLPRDPEGSTCDDPEYLRLVLDIQKAGFEIGYHLSSHKGVKRAQILAGLDRFRDLFGHDPHTMSNHQSNPEGIYWGQKRLSAPWRQIYRAVASVRGMPQASGDEPSSPYFWGDVCRERVRYVRSFVFRQINTLSTVPAMPYYDPKRPYVRAWFGSTYASWWPDFAKAVSEENQDALEASGGACILYTHFGAGFHDTNGNVHKRFRDLIKRLGSKSGWFVPVHELLDFMAQQRGVQTLGAYDRAKLESRWFRHKLLVRGTE